MEFKAFKMDGLGNDFVIIDQRHNHIELTNDQIKKICNWKFTIIKIIKIISI